jgi:AraC family transcriptional regulator
VQFQAAAGGWRSYVAALVPAHQAHAFEARSQKVAQIFVEPESQQGRRLQKQHPTEGVVELPLAALAPHIAALAAAYESRASDATLIGLARAAIADLCGAVAAAEKPPDQRIARAVELIRERLGDAVSLSAMAGAVHLSPDRFRHLFMQETGVTFRAYLLWQRLECALAAYVAGETLTEAAHTGGFADSAHFSRTFRKMFGIAPASVRPE